MRLFSDGRSWTSTRIFEMENTRTMQTTGEDLAPSFVVGLDTSTATSLRMAVIDPTADHFPWTDDLRCCYSPRALIRHWERRFPPLCQERLVLAINSTRHAETVLWLQ